MSFNRVPMWAKKPLHDKKVIATSKGWVVEETGEILVSIRDLDKKLAEYLGVDSVTFDNKNATIVAHEEITNESTVQAPVINTGTETVILDNQPTVQIQVVEAPVTNNVPDNLEASKPVSGEVKEATPQPTVQPVKRGRGRPKKVN